MMMSANISIVVCTFNRAMLLRGAIQSLLALNINDDMSCEIIVIDNGSADDTMMTVTSLIGNARIPIRYIHEPQSGVSFARNRGIAEATGEWIAFFDDDELADVQWIRELMAQAKTTGAVCVGGSVIPILSNGEEPDLPESALRIFGDTRRYRTDHPFSRNVTPGAGNLLIRRDVLLDLGGFDVTLRTTGEDTDLMRRLRSRGYLPVFAPLAIIRHIVPADRLTERFFYHTALRVGGAFAERDRRELSSCQLIALMLARMMKITVTTGPKLLLSRLTGNQRARLNANIDWWRNRGYLQHLLGVNNDCAQL